MPITVYSTSNCQMCKATKRALDRAGVPYSEVLLDANPGERERLKKAGFTSAPVVEYSLLTRESESGMWIGHSPTALGDMVALIDDQELPQDAVRVYAPSLTDPEVEKTLSFLHEQGVDVTIIHPASRGVPSYVANAEDFPVVEYEFDTIRTREGAFAGFRPSELKDLIASYEPDLEVDEDLSTPHIPGSTAPILHPREADGVPVETVDAEESSPTTQTVNHPHGSITRLSSPENSPFDTPAAPEVSREDERVRFRRHELVFTRAGILTVPLDDSEPDHEKTEQEAPGTDAPAPSSASEQGERGVANTAVDTTPLDRHSSVRRNITSKRRVSNPDQLAFDFDSLLSDQGKVEGHGGLVYGDEARSARGGVGAGTSDRAGGDREADLQRDGRERGISHGVSDIDNGEDDRGRASFREREAPRTRDRDGGRAGVSGGTRGRGYGELHPVSGEGVSRGSSLYGGVDGELGDVSSPRVVSENGGGDQLSEVSGDGLDSAGRDPRTPGRDGLGRPRGSRGESESPSDLGSTNRSMGESQRSDLPGLDSPDLGFMDEMEDLGVSTARGSGGSSLHPERESYGVLPENDEHRGASRTPDRGGSTTGTSSVEISSRRRVVDGRIGDDTDLSTTERDVAESTDTLSLPGMDISSYPEGSELGEMDRGVQSGDTLKRLAIKRFQLPSARGGSVRSRIEANIKAIEHLREAENPDPEILAGFTGWGGLGALFDLSKSEYLDQRQRLETLLSPSEFASARASILNAHYTDPALTSVIWRALDEAGMNQGVILEPGCGIGGFISTAPETVRVRGVELDPLTGELAQHLYPDDDISVEGFEKTEIDTYVDGVVANVPFGNYSLFDPEHNPGNHSIHNHFIIKSLDMMKPGAYGAFITSSFTMDAKNPGARRDMYSRADLVTAIRLPSGAHKSISGTEVVTDLLIFRKRSDGEEPQPFTWEHTEVIDLPVANTPGEMISHEINAYFAQNDTNVLGTMSVGSGMYGSHTLRVEGEGTLAPRLHAHLHVALTHTDLTYNPQNVSKPLPRLAFDTPAGTLRVSDTGAIEAMSIDGEWEVLPKLKKATAQELRSLIPLMEQTQRLLALESHLADNPPELASERQHLRDAYRAYHERYGAINRNTKTTSVRTKKDDDGNEIQVETTRVTYPDAVKTLRKDPRASLAIGLEKYNDDTGVAVEADILHTRQLFAKYRPQGAETLDDALAICLEQQGEIDTGYISYLLGEDASTIADKLINERLCFRDPETGELVTARDYLSGDVRAKLERVQGETDPAYAPNIEALSEVVPPDIPITEITTQIGANWIPVKVYQDFLRHIYQSTVPTVEETLPGTYRVLTSGAPNTSVRVTSQFGTPHMNAGKIFERLINKGTIQVYSNIDGDKTIDQQGTDAALEKAHAIQREFDSWVWSEPDRADMLHREYQKRFNSIVPPRFEDAGQALRLPGLTRSIQLYDHQKSAVARMVSEPTVGLFHEVGAGKTLEMACGVMEQKRLGLINKPLIVVPNHLIGQFHNEFLQAYPASRILAVDTERIKTSDDRALFFAQATMSDWDAIICTTSAFGKLSVSKETTLRYFDREMEKFENALAEIRAEGEIPVGDIERTVNGRKNALQRAINSVLKDADTDNPLSFEQLGIDYLVIDEAHYFKNLRVAGRFANELMGGESKRATDLDMKLMWLRENVGERCLTLATATPIANTMGEMWVMNHYLRPDILENAGLDSFDAWVSQFATKEENVEVSPKGTMRVVERYSHFQNLPELMRMWNTFADVKLSEDLKLKLPLARTREDGTRTPEPALVRMGGVTDQFLDRLGKRDDRIRSGGVKPWEDNFLAMTNDARAFTMDPRLIPVERAERAFGDMIDITMVDETKTDVASRTIARIYHENKDRPYPAIDGLGDDTPGALQIVFADLGTPKDDGSFSVYNELRDRLVDHGVPREKIAFIHDATNRTERDALFLKARTGQIAVLIGSTGKMGTGMNVQERAVAIHHLDVPWRPADLTQRNGRIFRQGNRNAEVSEYRYIAEKTLDSYNWQTLERKEKFIKQVMVGSFTGREVEDVSPAELDYEQMKAYATGNPLLVEKMKLSHELTKLQRQLGSLETEQRYLNGRIKSKQALLKLHSRVQQDAERVSGSYMPTFDLRLSEGGQGNAHYTSRSDALAGLTSLFKNVGDYAFHNRYAPQPRKDDIPPVWTINGIAFDVCILSNYPRVTGLPTHGIGLVPRDSHESWTIWESSTESLWSKMRLTLPLDELRAPTQGTITKLENLAHRVAELPAQIDEQRAGHENELRLAQEQLEGIHNVDLTGRISDLQSQIRDLNKRIRAEKHGQDELNLPHQRPRLR